MIPFGDYLEARGLSDGDGLLGPIEMTDGGGSNIVSSISMTEKSVSASKSHSEAERRRRERINGHLATLRALLPNATKTDKASLLAEVVQHVKELKKLAEMDHVDAANKPFPGETDELTLAYCNGSDESSSSTVLIRVSLSCDDRPELLSDLTRALRSVRARVVKAEMATVGGRTKSALVIQGSSRGDDELGALRRALKAILDKPAATARGQVLSGNKRPRLSHPLYY